VAVVERKTPGERVFDIFVYFALSVVTIICLYPMLHVLFASISNPLELMSHIDQYGGP